MIGIALEGGGAKGSYQVGALKALKNVVLNPNDSRNSIGSINAALICKVIIKNEEIWLNSTTDIFDLIATYKN